MRIEGGGFGFQAGGSATDVVMLVMSKKGMNGILSSKFTLGGEASVAAGPVGREATAQTDASMHADILSWSRSRGIFGGVSLQGATLRPDEDGDKALYGQKVDSKDVLTGQEKDVSPDPFTKELAEYGG
jgi:lipid-binding SYLF domain-containing protein